MEDTFELRFQEWRKQINEHLSCFLKVQDPPNLYEPIQYVLDGGGKRIRPILLLLACKAVGGNIDLAWDAAISVELLHNFTLVHDDIMDEDDTRRGRPTVHKKWAPGIAILAGDGLLAMAYQSLLRTRSPRIQEIANIFTDGVVEICEGQALDMDFETREGVKLPDYLAMIEKKTACLLNISARIGAIIGDGSANEIAALGMFGSNLGCAFQIQDDLLDIISDERTLGKTHGSDIKQKKQTYLLVHALSQADFELREKLKKLFSEPQINNAQIDEVKSLFEKVGSIAAAKSAIDKYIFSAKGNLDELRKTHERDILLSLLEYISNRNA